MSGYWGNSKYDPDGHFNNDRRFNSALEEKVRVYIMGELMPVEPLDVNEHREYERLKERVAKRCTCRSFDTFMQERCTIHH